MIAHADKPKATAELAASLPRVELERLFIGVVDGLLDERERRAVERALRRFEVEPSGGESE